MGDTPLLAIDLEMIVNSQVLAFAAAIPMAMRSTQRRSAQTRNRSLRRSLRGTKVSCHFPLTIKQK